MSVNGMVNLTESDGLVAKFNVGAEYNDGVNWYKYFKSSGAIAANALCTFLGTTFVASEGTTTTAGAIPGGYCIPQFAIAAANEYFWAPIGPFQTTKNGTTFKVLAANALPNVRIYTTATPGVVDDAVTAGLVSGLMLTATATTQAATACVASGRLQRNYDTA